MERSSRPTDRLTEFFYRTLWGSRRQDHAAIAWLAILLGRTGFLSLQGFIRNHGTLRASALTFFSLLSLVPVAALAFGIAKGFGFERRLRQELLEQFAAQQEVVERVVGFANNMLDNARGDMIAGIGIVALFWAVVKVLGNIENAFNHIWQVRPRAFARKLTDYLAIMLICPVLMILSGSLTVYITSQVSTLSGRFELLQMVGPAILLGLKLLPYLLIWVLFTLVYLIMPNTRVGIGGAILAGVAAGTAYQALQATYIHLQIGVAKYNAIYGSFAALPLFLLWLQVSWVIVLIGAEISHKFGLAADMGQPDVIDGMSHTHLRLLALMVCRQVVRRFHQGQPAQTPGQVAEALGLSPALVERLAGLLVSGNILVRLQGARESGAALQPARDIAHLTVAGVVAALEDVGTDGHPPLPADDTAPIPGILAALRKELERSAANRPIMEI